MKPRRLLVVTYYYPPQPGSGANRWAAMAKYLRHLGHDVTVITAAPPGHQPGESDGVVRTANLNSNPALRRVLLRNRRGTTEPAASAASVGTVPQPLWKLIVPDPWVLTWNPYAHRELRRRLGTEAFDCVITSSPAESTHLLPLGLGRHRPAWVADFRDGWGFEPIRAPFPLGPQRGIDRRLERRVATSAEMLVGVTVPIAEDLRRRFDASTRHIPNGFDPEVQIDAQPPPQWEADRITLVHTGQMVTSHGRDPGPLLSALRRLLDEQPDLADRLRILVAGRSEFDEQALLASSGLGNTVRYLGYLPRSTALALQRAADALLLVTSRATGEATGKLYEYLAAGRPIIALANDNEAARIVTETGTGVAVSPDEPDAIKSALQQAISGQLKQVYDPHGLEPYLYPAPAERMAEAVERAIALKRPSADTSA